MRLAGAVELPEHARTPGEDKLEFYVYQISKAVENDLTLVFFQAKLNPNAAANGGGTRGGLQLIVLYRRPAAPAVTDRGFDCVTPFCSQACPSGATSTAWSCAIAPSSTDLGFDARPHPDTQL